MSLAAITALICAVATQDVEAAVRKLSSDESEKRQQAEAELRAIGTPALEPLDRLIGGPDVDLSLRAQYIVRRIRLELRVGPKLVASVPRILERLDSPEPSAWIEEFFRLTTAPDNETPAPRITGADLAPLVATAFEEARTKEEVTRFCEAAARREIRAAIAPISTLLKGDDAEVAARALTALEKLRAEESVPDILDYLERTHGEARAAAVRTLAALGARSAIPVMVRCLNDADVACTESMAALAELRASEALPGLIDHLRWDDDIARAARDALVRIGDRAAVVLIVDRLRRGKLSWSPPAMHVLIALGEPEDADILLPFLESADPYARANAAVMLIRLERHGDRAIALLRDRSPRVRHAVLKIVWWMLLPEAAAEVVPLLEDPDPAIQRDAEQLLTVFPRAPIVPRIAALLDSPSAEARRSALQILLSNRATEYGPQIVRSLKDADEEVRVLAATALGELRVTDAASALIAAARRDESVYRQAVRALARFAAPESLPLLREAALSDDDLLLFDGAMGLAALGDSSGVRRLFERPVDQIGSSYVALNRLKEPALWERLKLMKVRVEKPAPRREVYEELVRPAGLRVEWGLPADAREQTDQEDWSRWNGSDLLMDGLGGLPGDLQVVFESDRIRILRRADALSFWREWLSGQK
jgi:HEAT repeat protein